jgi:hypothetical protein
MHMHTTTAASSWLAGLLRPQSYLRPRTLTLLVLLQAIAGLLLAQFGIRFDGAMDVHRTWLGTAPSFGAAFFDQIAAVPAAAAGGWLALRAWSVRVSYGSLLRLFGVARIPLVLVAPLVLTMPVPARLAAGGFAVGLLPASAALTGLLSVAAIVWMLASISLSVRALVPQRGGRLAALVVCVVLVAELFSKLMLIGVS